MRILVYLGHPAHYHLFKNIISKLKNDNHQVKILIRKKDILEDLLKSEGWEYINILPKGRGDTILSIMTPVIRRDIATYKIARKFHPEVMIGTSVEISHIGKIQRIPSIVVNEDDWDIVPLFSKLSYPFATHIMAPLSCRLGKWHMKNIPYDGYHELTYLHPKYFKPDPNRIKNTIDLNKRFFVIRFAKLNAHHDVGKTGITPQIAETIIKILEPFGDIYITSEIELEPQFESYRVSINPQDIHHVLYYADLYIGDSQTMAAEAAVLGTPSLRFNDFVGKIGYLNELEKRYQLTFGFKTSSPEKLYTKIRELIGSKGLKEEWNVKREKMLSDKIDVTSFFLWYIENYPDSKEIINTDPNYSQNFKN